MNIVNSEFQNLRLGLLELASTLVSLRAITVQTDVGTLWLPSDDKVITPWISHYHCWEPDEVAFFRSILGSGMNVLDIGANVGYYSLLFSEIVGTFGQVVALEPEPRNYALLCANLWASKAFNVDPIRSAANSFTGPIPLSLSDDTCGDHRPFVRSGATNVINVFGTRLDDLIRIDVKIDAVKIDVQGADHRVILGMEDLLKRSRPTLLVEFWPLGIEELGDRPIDVLSYYRSLELSVSLLQTRGVDYDAMGYEALVRAARSAEGGFGTLILEPM